jgi:hypothetical protein
MNDAHTPDINALAELPVLIGQQRQANPARYIPVPVHSFWWHGVTRRRKRPSASRCSLKARRNERRGDTGKPYPAWTRGSLSAGSSTPVFRNRARRGIDRNSSVVSFARSAPSISMLGMRDANR